jgi:hypothetical protein
VIIVGCVIVLVSVAALLFCTFGMWRAAGGSASGLRLSQMDRNAMPTGLKTGSVVARLTALVGVLVTIVGIVR